MPSCFFAVRTVSICPLLARGTLYLSQRAAHKYLSRSVGDATHKGFDRNAWRRLSGLTILPANAVILAGLRLTCRCYTPSNQMKAGARVRLALFVCNLSAVSTRSEPFYACSYTSRSLF